jgi:hypothetical protein
MDQDTKRAGERKERGKRECTGKMNTEVTEEKGRATEKKILGGVHQRD